MIQLKDVIQYYIGQRFMYSSHHEPQNETYVLRASMMGETIEFGDRPILRKLEDMNKEEAKYIINTYSFRSVDMPLNEVKFAIEITKRLCEQVGVMHYLLKQGFDLFGLCDSGQAIDSKTLNQKA